MDLQERKSSPEKQEVEQTMINFIKSTIKSDFMEILEPQLFPGKRIRPYFLYLLCKDLLPKDDLLQISIAIEMFHQASLMEDDMEDCTDERDGGRIALQKRIGNSLALCLTNLLYTISNEPLLGVKSIPLDKLQSLFLHMQYKMRQGQALDIAIKRSEGKSRLQTLTEDSYEKTKAFFNFPFTIYTELQQLDEQQKAEIEQTVNSFGILCQLGDDIIEIENGVKQEKLSLTFPLAYLLDNWEELETNEQNFLGSIIGQQRALTLEEAEGLTKIYRKYQTAITQSTKDIFNKNQIFLQNGPLPKEVQQAMLGISRQVCKPTFRDHSSSLL